MRSNHRLPLRTGLLKSLLAVLPLALLGLPSVAYAIDSDSDGTADQFDAFPCDPTAASVTFTPGQGSHGMMMFEDQWPSMGDNDFNDVVVSYNYIFVRTADGRVSSIRATFNALAVGGLFNNGLALHLPVGANSVARVTKQVGASGAVQTLSPQGAESELVLQLSDNVRELLGNQAGPINSRTDVAPLRGEPLEINIKFSTPVTLNTAAAPFDLFIFRTQDTTYQIHRPEFPGTATMNQALFHTADDASSASRHFVDRTGLPYALIFPTVTPWAQEASAISLLYPDIVPFAASSGVQNQDFYLTHIQSQYAWVNQLAPGAGSSSGSTPPAVDPNLLPRPVFIGSSNVPADTGCVVTWSTAVQFGSIAEDWSYDAAINHDGNVLIAGYTYGSLPGNSNRGGMDLFVAQYNRSTQQPMWIRQLGGTGQDRAHGVAVDSANNVFIVGHTTGDAFELANSAPGHYDAYLTKLDSDGSVLWSRMLGQGASSDELAWGVSVTPTGDILVSGYTTGTLPGATRVGSSTNAFVAKYNTSGTLLWTRQFGSPANNTYGQGIASDANGDVLVTGYTYGSLSANTSYGTNYTAYLAKLSGADGSSLWTQELQTPYYTSSADFNSSFGLRVITDPAGSAYVVGNAYGPSGASVFSNPRRGGTDALVYKVDASGAFQWARLMGASGNDLAQGVSLDTSGRVLIAGRIGGANSLTGQYSRGGNDYFATALDAAGTSLWVTQNGTSADDESSAAVNDSFGLFVVGNTMGSFAGRTSQGSWDIFLTRHNVQTGIGDANTGIVTNSSGGRNWVNGTYAKSCYDYLHPAIGYTYAGATGNGLYTINPAGGADTQFNAYCDMTSDGGGWTAVTTTRFNPIAPTSWDTVNTYQLRQLNALGSTPGICNENPPGSRNGNTGMHGGAHIAWNYDFRNLIGNKNLEIRWRNFDYGPEGCAIGSQCFAGYSFLTVWSGAPQRLNTLYCYAEPGVDMAGEQRIWISPPTWGSAGSVPASINGVQTYQGDTTLPIYLRYSNRWFPGSAWNVDYGDIVEIWIR